MEYVGSTDPTARLKPQLEHGYHIDSTKVSVHITVSSLQTLPRRYGPDTVTYVSGRTHCGTETELFIAHQQFSDSRGLWHRRQEVGPAPERGLAAGEQPAWRGRYTEHPKGDANAARPLGPLHVATRQYQCFGRTRRLLRKRCEYKSVLHVELGAP